MSRQWGVLDFGAKIWYAYACKSVSSPEVLMNEKEIGELRRRLKPEKTTITHIRGCYVNEKREVVSQFNQPISVLSEEEGEQVLALLKKSLSGTQGKNLVDLTFTTNQVASGEAHKLLMALRDGGLEDQETVEQFYRKIIDSVTFDSSYLILLAADAYDVPFKGKDDMVLADGSETVFRYILCAICPVKLAKPALTYYVTAGEFHNRTSDWLVGAPQLGFLFPAFDDRATNLYGALLYTRNLAENHEEFVEAVFGATAPMAAAQQMEHFQTILGLTLEEDCCLETVQAVRGQFCAMIQEHKESKEPTPLTINKATVKGVLASCGVSDDHVEAFDREYDQVFGPDADLSPRNVVDPKRLELKTPDVTIRVAPERGDLLETRVLGGVKYILIRADEGVEVNGIDINIED